MSEKVQLQCPDTNMLALQQGVLMIFQDYNLKCEERVKGVNKNETMFESVESCYVYCRKWSID